MKTRALKSAILCSSGSGAFRVLMEAVKAVGPDRTETNTSLQTASSQKAHAAPQWLSLWGRWQRELGCLGEGLTPQGPASRGRLTSSVFRRTGLTHPIFQMRKPRLGSGKELTHVTRWLLGFPPGPWDPGSPSEGRRTRGVGEGRGGGGGRAERGRPSLAEAGSEPLISKLQRWRTPVAGATEWS